MGLFLSFIFGFAPMLVYAGFVYWLDRYEKEPRLLLGGVFIWGALVAAGGAFLVNTLLGMGVYVFTNSEHFTRLTTGSLIAPLVEESLKGLAVLGVFLLFRREFDSILDGMIYAAIVALGFAASENVYYIYQYGFLEEGYQGLAAVVIVRILLVGWQHPFYTAFTGIGLAFSRLSRNTASQILAPILGWSLAVAAHSLHNSLAALVPGVPGLALGSLVDWTGWLFMFGLVMVAARTEQRYITALLLEEVGFGTLSAGQYSTACSAWAQSLTRFTSLFSGRFASTNRFYQLTAELAHKKHQLLVMGDEGGNLETIVSLRAELGKLSPGVPAF